MPGLDRYQAIAEMISQLLHPYAEVVLHDFQANRIAAIFNAFSKRKPGDDSLIEDAQALAAGPNIHGPFLKKIAGGRDIKTTTTVLRGDDGEAIGLLCVNLDVSLLVGLQRQVGDFLNCKAETAALDAHFEEDWQDRITSFVHQYLMERHLSLGALSRENRGHLVKALEAAGALKIKNGASFAARVLGVSRATVYNDLAE